MTKLVSKFQKGGTSTVKFKQFSNNNDNTRVVTNAPKSLEELKIKENLKNDEIRKSFGEIRSLGGSPVDDPRTPAEKAKDYLDPIKGVIER